MIGNIEPNAFPGTPIWVSSSTGDQKHAYGLLKKVKLADKSRNLEMLGRYFKLFTGDKDDLEAERVTTIIVDL